MNQRQKKILASVIEEYTNTAVAVPSELIVKKYKLGFSSATVRNDMNVLEREGYLYQPHISSGRIPTDKGYRYFVEKIMKEKELSQREQKRVQKELLKLKAQNKRITRTTAKLLSVLSGSLAISGLPNQNEFSEFGIKELLSQPEFRKMDEICRLAEALDYIDVKIDLLLKGIKTGETKIIIGKENPVAEMQECSMLISPFRLSDGEKAILALIGPKRMKYAKNKSLIEYIKKLLGSSTVPVVIVNILNLSS